MGWGAASLLRLLMTNFLACGPCISGAAQRPLGLLNGRTTHDSSSMSFDPGRMTSHAMSLCAFFCEINLKATAGNRSPCDRAIPARRDNRFLYMAGDEIAWRRPDKHNNFSDSSGKSCGSSPKRKIIFAPLEHKTLWPTRYTVPVDMRPPYSVPRAPEEFRELRRADPVQIDFLSRQRGAPRLA